MKEIILFTALFSIGICATYLVFRSAALVKEMRIKALAEVYSERETYELIMIKSKMENGDAPPKHVPRIIPYEHIAAIKMVLNHRKRLSLD